MTPADSYEPIRRAGSGRPDVHCEALTGRLVISGPCWGDVGLVESRLLGRAVPRCQGHAGPMYRPEKSTEVRE